MNVCGIIITPKMAAPMEHFFSEFQSLLTSLKKLDFKHSFCSLLCEFIHYLWKGFSRLRPPLRLQTTTYSPASCVCFPESVKMLISYFGVGCIQILNVLRYCYTFFARHIGVAKGHYGVQSTWPITFILPGKLIVCSRQ